MSDLPRGGLEDIKLVSYDASEAEQRVVDALQTALGTTISTADPRRLIALALCQSIIQTCVNADYGAKQTLLSYATGSALDHLGYFLGISRPQATKATCLATFTRSSTSGAVTIDAGLICKGGDLEWVAEGFSFASGLDRVTNVLLTCKTAGTIGNGLSIGEIKTISTPHVVVNGVSNTTVTSGAIDESDDDAYADLIRLGTDAFSVAGPIGAYEYYAKSASEDVQDVKVTSPSPAYIKMYVLATGGVEPSEELLNKVASACSDDTVRPVGDNVSVLAPSPVSFKPDAAFYVSKQVAALRGEQIVEDECRKAYGEYLLWQRGAIGRDIVPEKLVQMLMNAGAKRVETFFERVVIGDTEFALPVDGTLTYGGVEDE